MFGFGRQDSDDTDRGERPGLFARLREGLRKTRAGLTGRLGALLRGRTGIDQDLLDEIETLLLTSDAGIEATTAIMDTLRERVRRNELGDGDAVFAALRAAMLDVLQPVERPLEIPARHGAPFVILMVGVNGAGKTTSIGKLAHRYRAAGRRVMLAAGDTFRAAAVEQLQAWGERNDVPVIAQQTGADSASVIYDAVMAARARNIDVLIADTAGRLHTQDNLMEEIRKVIRVIRKLDPDAPHEILLAIDAGTGQNALAQAEQFRQAAGVSGLVLTKLDGTAKGGIIFAIARRLDIPIRFVGVGEQAGDLRPFVAAEFVDALLAADGAA